MLPIILLVTFVSATLAQRPLGLGPEGLLGDQALLRNGLTPSATAVTLQRTSENLGDGNFQWSFETSDGTRQEQTGFLKNPDPLNEEGVQAVMGSYSYISPEGIQITVNYIADENGFQPIGDHIPGNNLRRNLYAGAQPAALAARPFLPNPNAALLGNVRPGSPVLAPELLGEAAYPNRFRGVVDPYSGAGLNRFNPYRLNNVGLRGPQRGPIGFGDRFVQ